MAPGSGVGLAALMPALGLAEMIEVTAIHCTAGLLGSCHALGWPPATGGGQSTAAGPAQPRTERHCGERDKPSPSGHCARRLRLPNDIVTEVGGRQMLLRGPVRQSRQLFESARPEASLCPSYGSAASYP